MSAFNQESELCLSILRYLFVNTMIRIRMVDSIHSYLAIWHVFFNQIWKSIWGSPNIKRFSICMKKWSESHSAVSDYLRPQDCSSPGSSFHGIFQARILEWVAVPSPGYLSNPGIKARSPTLQADSLLSDPPGKPKNMSG